MVRGSALQVKPLATLFTLLAFVTFLTQPSQAIPAVTRNGKYLFQGNNRFYIKGLAYQEPAPIAVSTQANDENGGFPEPDSFTDPLALPDACTRDVANFQDLSINTIRVYSVNASLNHDACMSTFSNAGIYVILDLALPANGSINRAMPSWDVGLLDHYARTIDVFTKYDNLLAVNVANEVVTQASNTVAAPFITAAVRDTKAYLKSKNSNVLVSYSSTDGPSGADQWREMLANYLTCGNADESVDLYGLNSYSWCGESSFAGSGYNTLTNDFSALPVPTYLSEFGCVDGVGTGMRPWTEVAALYSTPMTNTFSGGVAFSYFPQPSGLDYGLVNVTGNTVTRRADWANLKREFAGTTTAPTTAPAGAAAPTFATCQGGTTNFLASTNLPPTPSPALCNCLESNAFSCVLTSAAKNAPPIVGQLTGQACTYLSQQGGTCAPILADGEMGVYGNYSSCSAAQRLEWAMSQYFELTSFNAESCDFAGNATVKSPPPATSAAISDAFSSCLNTNPIGVFTPKPDSSVTTTNNNSPASSDSLAPASTASQSKAGSGAARSLGVQSISFASLATVLAAVTWALL